MPTQLVPLQIIEGVEPSTDRSNSTTQHYIDSKGVRFVDGYPQKKGGNVSLSFDGDVTISGLPRSIFSYILSSYTRYLVGTNSKLYDIFGTTLTNITPLKTATVSIADSLDTFYGTLSSNPITTVSGSATITISDTAHKLQAGDTVTLSGSSAVNGIPGTDINTSHFVRSVTTNSWTIIVATAATSSGTGGGASVVRATGIITVNASAHGQLDGDRTKIASAADTGGITAAQINLEFIIRNAQTNSFDIYTAGTATSAVTGGGGSSTTYQVEITDGNENTAAGFGYGMGLYGAGLYGVGKTSSNTDPPRIWSHDRFGDLTISMSNDQSELYSWDGDISEAPVIVSNAPQGNYCFVSDNIAVVLGAEGVGNRIQWSDQGGLTNWTTGQSGEDDIEGAGKFISHASVRGDNLIYTNNQTYYFRYIGGELIWQTKLIDANIGLIAQNARSSASGVIYWMSNNNFHMWRGGNVEVIPSNSTTHSTCLRYVFDDINFGQKEKIFCQYNPLFREITWFYPSAGSSEPDRAVSVNIDTFAWWYDEIERTAVEYPSLLSQTPYMADSSGTVYLHENGLNDNGAAKEWYFETPFIFGGNNIIGHNAFVVDGSVTQTASVTIKTKDYPFSSVRSNKSYDITSTSTRIATGQSGRYWNYKVSGDDLGQRFVGGQWYQELLQESPK